MSRKIAALGAFAVAGAMLVVPDSSSARGGGFRGGFHGVRAPVVIARHAHSTFRPGFRAHPDQFRHPVLPRVSHILARTTVRAPFVHLARRSHGAYIYGSTYPITGDDDAAYFGMPYDPAAAIPVYGPAPLIQQVDPAAPPPERRLNARDENQEACRAERVTVPAVEGEREITVVRC